MCTFVIMYMYISPSSLIFENLVGGGGGEPPTPPLNPPMQNKPKRFLVIYFMVKRPEYIDFESNVRVLTESGHQKLIMRNFRTYIAI